MLPPEIVEVVLRQGCFNSSPQEISSLLRTSCLVCQTWKSIAQPLLFSEQPLSRSIQQRTPSRFVTGLVKYPHLRPYVKCVWFCYDWISAEYLLAELLPRVQEFTIQGQRYPIDPPLAVLALLQKLPVAALSSGLLTRLCLTEVLDFPVQVFYHCPTLCELLIEDSTFVGFSLETGGIHNLYNGNGDNHVACLRPAGANIAHDLADCKRPRLRSLSIENSGPIDDSEDIDTDLWILLWLTHSECAFDFGSLQSLHFKALACQGPALTALISKLFDVVFPSLRHLSWTFPEPNLVIYYPYIARRAPECLTAFARASPKLLNLSRLTLAVKDYHGPLSSLPWIPDLLQHLPHPEKLQELIIPVTYNIPVCMELVPYNWNRLGLFFSPERSSSKFPNLEMFQIGLYIRMKAQGIEKELRDFLALTFSALNEKGILHVVQAELPGYVYARDCWHYYKLH
ncbi:hypothetical protein BDN72DRAFT_100399 [Pluteus cervinus]|uniref:Uncharacterized protein n=1 Tax=Pluteus cervinus TaxID=181527 RepID=A0ACD3B8Y5_9AGAR|nr:hypothetical protein BDN72DRAFT_100399 [Pluteus cervinus]